MSPWKLLAATPTMNRPVGASSTAVTMSANERLGKGSLRSGPTSVMFRPGMLGNVAGGSPAPTGGARRVRLPGDRRAAPATAARAAGTSIGGMVSGAGLNRLLDPNGAGAGRALGPPPSRGTLPGARQRLGGGDAAPRPSPGPASAPGVTPSPRSGIIRSPYGLSLGPPVDDLDLDRLALLGVRVEVAAASAAAA